MLTQVAPACLANRIVASFILRSTAVKMFFPPSAMILFCWATAIANTQADTTFVPHPASDNAAVFKAMDTSEKWREIFEETGTGPYGFKIIVDGGGDAGRPQSATTSRVLTPHILIDAEVGEGGRRVVVFTNGFSGFPGSNPQVVVMTDPDYEPLDWLDVSGARRAASMVQVSVREDGTPLLHIFNQLRGVKFPRSEVPPSVLSCPHLDFIRNRVLHS